MVEREQPFSKVKTFRVAFVTGSQCFCIFSLKLQPCLMISFFTRCSFRVHLPSVVVSSQRIHVHDFYNKCQVIFTALMQQINAFIFFFVMNMCVFDMGIALIIFLWFHTFLNRNTSCLDNLHQALLFKEGVWTAC